MDKKLIKKLQAYIKTELADVALYHELAQMAPDEEEMNLMLEIADDEQVHADEFQLIYKSLTGETYQPNIPPVRINTSYEDILRDRVIEESEDFRKYMYDHREYFTDEVLREAFYLAAIDENVHAIKLLHILDEN